MSASGRLGGPITHTFDSDETPPPMPSSWRMLGSGEPMNERKIGAHSSRLAGEIAGVEDDGLRRAAAHEDGRKLSLRHGTPRICGCRLDRKTNLKATAMGSGMEVAVEPPRAAQTAASVSVRLPFCCGRCVGQIRLISSCDRSLQALQCRPCFRSTCQSKWAVRLGRRTRTELPEQAP